MINIAGCDHESEGVYGVGSDHTFRHSFAVPLTYVEVVMENIMPIHIRHRDKNTAAVQQADVAWIIIEMRPSCRRLIRHL